MHPRIGTERYRSHLIVVRQHERQDDRDAKVSAEDDGQRQDDAERNGAFRVLGLLAWARGTKFRSFKRRYCMISPSFSGSRVPGSSASGFIAHRRVSPSYFTAIYSTKTALLLVFNRLDRGRNPFALFWGRFCSGRTLVECYPFPATVFALREEVLEPNEPVAAMESNPTKAKKHLAAPAMIPANPNGAKPPWPQLLVQLTAAAQSNWQSSTWMCQLVMLALNLKREKKQRKNAIYQKTRFIYLWKF